MIDKIVTAYLKNNKRLVIPDFGAFINKDNEEVVFVEFLKKDDQVLSSLLCKEYSIDEVDARNVIEEYVAMIRRAVGTTGRYAIDGLGFIRTDANGLYSLAYDPRARKEAAEVIVPAPQEPAAPAVQAPPPQPAMQVVTRVRETTEPAGGNMPTPSRDEIEQAAKSPNIIEFGVREQAPPAPEPKHETKKPFTLNDLYSIPAVDNCDETPSRPAAATHQSRPAATHSGERRVQRPADNPPPSERRVQRPTGVRHDRRMEDEWELEERPRRRPVNAKRKGRSKADWIMIVAILAALIAIGSLIYGIAVQRGPKIKPTNTEIENVIDVETSGLEQEAGE